MQHHDTRPLSEAHARTLLEESGIAPDVIGERGYRTVRRADVPEDFAAYQRRNGLLTPLYSPDGITRGYQLRPDRPRRDRRGKPIKYETPTGARIIADVHPRMAGAASDPDRDLWITEGIKKGDAFASRGRCAIALVGVWMFRLKDGEELLPCFDHVALSGRRVFVVYDSDVMTKPEVALALERLIGDLERRGARPLVVYLPDAPDGSKQGADDYLAAGGTVEELEELARPFDAGDAARERLRRDAPLRDRIAALWRNWSAADWSGIGGHSRREVLRALIDGAQRRGQRTRRGPLVSGAMRPLAERAGVSINAVSRALDALEADGWLAADATPRPKHAGRYFVLLTPGGEGRARGIHNGKKQGGRDRGRAAHERRGFDHSVYPLRGGAAHAANPRVERGLDEIKRLRWPYAARWFDQSSRSYVYEYVERLGKIAGRCVEALLEAGGEAALEELAAAVGARRVRDLRRRQLARLEASGIARVEGDMVSLADDWLEKLGIARELGGEYEAEDRARQRHRASREAYAEHRAGKHKADRAPTREEMDSDRRREWRRKRRRIDELVDRGMRRDFAAREVIRADGYAGELERLEPEPPAPARKLPPLVDGVYAHGQECGCWLCAPAAPC